MIDTSNPAQVAQFLLGLGYDKSQVVNTVEKRCTLSTSEAHEIVNAAQDAVTATRQSEAACFDRMSIEAEHTTEGGQA